MKVYGFVSKLYSRLGLQGKALKLAVKHHEDKQSKETDKAVVDIMNDLGWVHAVR